MITIQSKFIYWFCNWCNGLVTICNYQLFLLCPMSMATLLSLDSHSLITRTICVLSAKQIHISKQTMDMKNKAITLQTFAGL